MKKLVSLRIVPAAQDDEDAVFEFLSDSFFVDEPMNSYLKRRPSKDQFGPLNYVREGYSFVAYAVHNDGTETMAGVVINKIEKREKEKVPTPPQEESRRYIAKALDALEKKFDVWSRVKIDRLFYTVILSVSRDYRGLSIGRKLIEASLQKARECELTHAIVECSSFYSAQIIEKFGYEKVGEILYEDFRNENGEVIFHIEKPHKGIYKFIKEL